MHLATAATLQRVETAAVRLEAYRDHVQPALLTQIRALAAPLRGARVVHINATPNGGGVAEILRSLVPLSRDLGLDAHWYVLPPDVGFFNVTKKLHNWLQGQPGEFTSEERRTYATYLQRVAESMGEMAADVWIIHDPQPLPLRSLVPLRGATIWRCHIDCSTPNAKVRDYLSPWVLEYDRALFSMPQFVLPGMSGEQARVVYPAIDPLTPKNCYMPTNEAHAILASLGIDTGRPLVAQISRFDPWKNPWQAVDAYRIAKRQIPGLQLALVGVFAARDDPEGPRIYRAIRRYVGKDQDVHLFTDATRIGQREVNAFQSASYVILQRSTREGFGLTVTEAMWKAKPVIATPVGGIAVQIQHGENGFLVENTEQCADLIVRLVSDPGVAHTIGQAARRSVQDHFLLPRLLKDELELCSELVGSQPAEKLAA